MCASSSMSLATGQDSSPRSGPSKGQSISFLKIRVEKKSIIWTEDRLKAEIVLIGICISYNAGKYSTFDVRYSCLDRMVTGTLICFRSFLHLSLS